MAIPKQTIWPLDEHTKVKHEILRRYLEAWFPILATKHDRILFIDGFCGPGRYSGGEEGSPLVALDVAANHSRNFKEELIFYFIDADQARINHLIEEIKLREDPENFVKFVKCAKFDEELKGLLDGLEASKQALAPTFAFVDPFGFGGIPYDLIARLLKNPRSEVLINFDADSMARFLTQAQVSPQIVTAVGDSRVLEIAQAGGDRVDALRHLYQEQLLKCAKFVRYFKMIDKRERISYYLFFASNNRMGHLKFKEALWKVDPSGEFRFSDATAGLPVLFGLEAEEQIPAVKNLLFSRYSGGLKVRRNDILAFIEDETPFLAKHMNCTLKDLEANGKIQAEATKVDGTPRRKNSFPEGTLINFTRPA